VRGERSRRRWDELLDPGKDGLAEDEEGKGHMTLTSDERTTEVPMTTTLSPRKGRRAAGTGALLIFGAVFASLPAGRARSEGPVQAANVVVSWPNAERMTPEELAKLLQAPGAEKPLMFHVGFRVLYTQAHIPGSQYAGPGKDPSAVDVLGKAVAALPRTTPIVLYCGCCPWERCPNLEKPWTMLQAAGFTRVKVLYIEKNFGRDWVQKGYPSEASRG
jgi:thiosulfate/3-mercaptopyruvate sulfurtransferase